MIEYIKFWLAKEVLVPLIIASVVVGTFGVCVLVVVLSGKFRAVKGKELDQ